MKSRAFGCYAPEQVLRTCNSGDRIQIKQDGTLEGRKKSGIQIKQDGYRKDLEHIRQREEFWNSISHILFYEEMFYEFY